MYNESLEQVKESFLEDLKYELEAIDKNDTKEVYFHDKLHPIIDDHVSSNTRAENLEIIDDIGGEEDIDSGMVDKNADITMQIAQIAYCVLEQELFNDDFIQELQTDMNNEKLTYKQARKIIKKIDSHLKEQ